jgi:predicted O-linked N-acetylglucosamine transferase (SPINDLY family)
MDRPLDIVSYLYAAAQRRRAAGDPTGAAVLLDEVLQVASDHQQALSELASANLDKNPHAAATFASRLVRAAPNIAANWTLLGQAVAGLSRADEALRAFEQAAKLAPCDASAWSNFTIARMRAGDPHAAVEAGRRAVELDPKMPEAHAGLGHALNVLQRSQEAVTCFEAALRLRPAYPDALLGMSTAQRDLGRTSSAIIALLRAREISAGARDYAMSLAYLYEEFGDLEAARRTRHEAATLSPSLVFESAALMSEQYDPYLDDRAAAESARQWGLRQAAARPIPLRPLAPGGKIRIGYVSADLYRHPVGWLGAPAIGAHDRDAFHVTIYANQTRADDLTARLKTETDRWVPILGLDDDQAAAKIVEDGIDILVDLSGHTAGNRLGVFARRPAPVQLSWLGYFATTGLSTMDYILLDDAHLVPGAEELFVEKVIRLPHGRFCYRPPEDAPESERLASDGRIVFASFNNAAKINGQVLALWAKVLAATPDSDLLLKWRSFADPLLQARIRADFGKMGVDPARIKFEGASPHQEMLARYNHIDIALDPFPFSGGLTSCEALWMGVPVITLPGSRPVSRQTHSILKSIGHGEWSTSTEEAYIQRAASLAADAAARRSVRANLRKEINNSVLCDAKSFARLLEKSYASILQELMK